ncbi:LLM class flavin-dependent oxidoreductase [Cellulomonas massiliensis]|uniref:LLM class flavin-dependent oxidoreductase n=1 Tax=Cellulomonas massiliensis TaxID=1465811 RepID=UPI0003146D5F|nr:LLM class flavin-dependent oxidoreductase [Cellulomonas massiliensis]
MSPRDAVRTRPAVLLPRDLPAGAVLPYARRAEALGFHELWVVEDLGFRGGFAQAAAVLAATSRLRVAVGILPAAVRNVAFAAMEAATLAQLFPGRLTVGVGHGMPGWMRSVGAWPPQPLALLEEHVQALRALLRGERVSAEGRYVRLDEVALDPSAVPDEPPDVVLGVRGPRSLAVSGRVADGTVLAEPCAPEYVRAAVAQIAPTGPHRVVTYDVASVRDATAAAVEDVRPALAWVGDPDWAPHLAPLPFAEELAALRASAATREHFARALPQAWVTRLALAGTPDEVRAGIAARAAAGATTSVLLPTGDPVAALDRLAGVL